MSSPSNLYAEKIFSEHPKSLWALDDKCDYISLINESFRDMDSWEITGGINSEYSISDEPFPESVTTKITGNVIPDNILGTIVCVSPDMSLNLNQLNSDLGTFTVGTYIKSLSPYFAGIEIGYEYDDTTSGELVRNLKPFSVSVSDTWILGSETFMIPDENTSFRIVLKIKYYGGAEENTSNIFLLNGLSVGQWSEEFNSNSLGVFPVTLPQNLPVDQSYGIEAKAYGLSEQSGYYLISEDLTFLGAKNSGVPMVFGASNTTIVRPMSGPSLIIPGVGFLNESGKHKEYTVEMWLKIDSYTSDDTRIFGPVKSTDGLYVSGPFLKLKVGEYVGAHCVGEWSRPMLIHIRVVDDTASLLLNGDEVISFTIDQSSITFPDKSKTIGGITVDQDWLGFYASEYIPRFELDCVAVYSYKVPTTVAKRRFVYGQGVEFAESINSGFGGTSVYFDFPFSKYTNNYTYPDIGRWSQGIVDNLRIDNNILSIPNYQLPSITLNKSNALNFINTHNSTSIQAEQDNFITFGISRYLDSTEFDNLQGNLVFSNIDLIGGQTKAVYGIFKNKTLTQNKQILFRIEDLTNGNYLSVDLEMEDVKYRFKFNGEESVIESAPGYIINEVFAVGFNIKAFSDYYGQNLSTFFGNPSNLSVYVGGSRELSNTFLGNIYSFGFCNSRNLSKIKDSFGETGVVLFNENAFDNLSETVADSDLYSRSMWDYFLDGGSPRSFAVSNLHSHVGTYTLRPRLYMEKFILDIDSNGYWEDYVPLTYFAKYVEDITGSMYYDLDFLQLNIDYPTPNIYKEVEKKTGTWTYQELQYEYQAPLQRTYSSLDNHLYTGYNDYLDLKNRVNKNYAYDTDAALLKSYISFQYIATGANANHRFFTDIDDAPQNGVIQPLDGWTTTKYEFVNNMIAYPPKGVDFNDLALVMHLDFNVSGILSNPIKVKKMQVASQAFNSNSFNPIGTRFSEDVYPYQKSGIYYDYKALNPFTIYKGSSPYLYLTRTSGIELRGGYDPMVDRGIAIPINKSKNPNYKVMALQAGIRYDKDAFPLSPTEIFQVEDKNSLIKFYIQAIQQDGKRGKIYAINYKTGQRENGIGYYLNGNVVREAVITVGEWAFLGISFSKLLDFSEYSGSLKLNGPLLFNAISYYQSIRLQQVQKKFTRPWFKLMGSGSYDLNWTYWYGSFTWNETLIQSTTNLYGVDPADIYSAYIGTNKIVVGDNYGLSLKNYEYSLYSDVVWNKTVQDAL